MSDGAAPTISVVVPVYDVEGYVAACLDSLLAQTFADFEIVVVDDGSTDGSSAIVERYAETHPHHIRVLRKPNGGLADARNFGIEHARGRWLAFVDADDIVEPAFLAAMHTAAVEAGADLVLCGMRSLTDGESPAPYIREPDLSVFGTSLAEEPRLLYRVDASACDKLYARHLFDETGIRFPTGALFEDLPTVYGLLPAARRVVKVDEPLYLYRRGRQGSITGGYGEGFLELVSALRALDERYDALGILGTLKGPMLRLHLTHLIAGRYPDLFAEATSASRGRFLDAAFALLDEGFGGWRGGAEARELWPNPLLRVVSTHRPVLAAFCALPRRAYFALLLRLGAFDPLR